MPPAAPGESSHRQSTRHTASVFLLPRRTARLLRHVGLAAAVTCRALVQRRPVAECFAERIFVFGPAVIKAAQILATREDLLAPSVCHLLGRAWRDVPPRTPHDKLTATLERLPLTPTGQSTLIGSGSIAAVYRVSVPATDPEQPTRLAVKILHRGVTTAVQDDLALLVGGARILGSLLPALKGVPVRSMALAVADAIANQVDTAKEEENLRRLARVFPDGHSVRVPDVVWRDTGVLVMTDEQAPTSAEVSLDEAQAYALVEALYTMIFTAGFVHVDLHPGNVGVKQDSTLVLYDAGFVVELSDRMRLALAEFFYGLLRTDSDRCRAAILAAADGVGPGHDPDAFRSDVHAVIARWGGLSAADFSLTEFTSDLFEAHRNHKVHVSAEFVFPLLALLCIETQVKRAVPHMDFQGLALPHVLRTMQSPAMQARRRAVRGMAAGR